MSERSVARAWDAEYRAGRYRGEPPVDFIHDILAAARAHRLSAAEGLYVGCGNGRNYLPLVAGGLDLLGLDISPTALAQLKERAPERAPRLRCGDLAILPRGARYAVVIAIQVLQHGNEAMAHRAVIRTRERVAPGGLLCIRVNAVGTEIEHDHERTETGGDGRFTVQYRGTQEGAAGPLLHRSGTRGVGRRRVRRGLAVAARSHPTRVSPARFLGTMGRHLALPPGTGRGPAASV